MPQVFSLPFKNKAVHPLVGVTVLQIIPSLEVNPTARAVIEIAAALGTAGARALVACAGGRMEGELQAKGGVFVPFPSRTKNPLAMALNVRRLTRLIAAENADIVHVRSRALAWVAYGATRLTKTPFVTTFPSVYQGSNAIALRYNSVLARGDVVLADFRLHRGSHRQAPLPGGRKNPRRSSWARLPSFHAARCRARPRSDDAAALEGRAA